MVQTLQQEDEHYEDNDLSTLTLFELFGIKLDTIGLDTLPVVSI